MRLGKVLVMLGALLTLGCGGGSDSVTGTKTQPASVAGYWVATSVNNAGSAILSGCTGDFASLNGLTVAAIFSTATCTNTEAQYTSQNGSSYTHSAVGYACDNGDWGTRAGGGTVSGNTIKGQMDTISGYLGNTGSAYITGTKTGSATLSISEYKVTTSGTIVGSCTITPALSISMAIYASVPMIGRTATLAPRPLESDDLVNYLRVGSGKP